MMYWNGFTATLGALTAIILVVVLVMILAKRRTVRRSLLESYLERMKTAGHYEECARVKQALDGHNGIGKVKMPKGLKQVSDIVIVEDGIRIKKRIVGPFDKEYEDDGML